MILMMWRVFSSVVVSWRSERRCKERPEAVKLSGCWVAVEVQEAWVEGPQHAGEPLRWVFVVESELGHRYKIVRNSDGHEQVAAWCDPGGHTEPVN